MHEFQIINQYFLKLSKNNKSSLNLNDDVFFDKSKKLVVSVDTYVEGVHFINFRKPELVIKKIIRKEIGFKGILISDDISMKSLKGTLQQNTIKTFNAGCNLALHCNGNLKEMEIVGKNSPLINKFINKKTSQFYKILS